MPNEFECARCHLVHVIEDGRGYFVFGNDLEPDIIPVYYSEYPGATRQLAYQVSPCCDPNEQPMTAGEYSYSLSCTNGSVYRD